MSLTLTPDLGTSGGITAYAEGRTSAADSYILKLGQLALSLNPPTINAEFPGPRRRSADHPPACPRPSLRSCGRRLLSRRPFSGTLDVADILPAAFDDAPPVMSFPTAPTPFSDALPDSPGIDFTYDMPTLEIALAPPPALLSLNISKFDGLNLPAPLDNNVPELNIVAPSIREYQPGSLYTSTLLQSLQARLLDTLTRGGTGLAPDVEQAIWDRGREREARSQADAIEALDKMETLGYSLPPGIWLDARVKITTEGQYTFAGLSREVMIKQAELEQENVKQALTVAVQLEGQLMTYTNSVEQRLFESCKYATEAGIAIYNGKVQAYTAFVDAYKTKVAIYEAQIRGELARVDAYRPIDRRRAGEGRHQ
jgi:hypothetical protein